jgi:hypothetical protein
MTVMSRRSWVLSATALFVLVVACCCGQPLVAVPSGADFRAQAFGVPGTVTVQSCSYVGGSDGSHCWGDFRSDVDGTTRLVEFYDADEQWHLRDRVEADLISEDSNRAYVRRGSLVGEIACMAVMGVMVTVLAVILLLAVRRLQRR